MARLVPPNILPFVPPSREMPKSFAYWQSLSQNSLGMPCIHPSNPPWFPSSDLHYSLNPQIPIRRHTYILLFLLRFPLDDLDALAPEVVCIRAIALAETQLFGLFVQLLFLLLGGGVEQIWADKEVGADDGDDADPALGRHFLKGLDAVVDEAVLPLDNILDYVVHFGTNVKGSLAASRGCEVVCDKRLVARCGLGAALVDVCCW